MRFDTLHQALDSGETLVFGHRGAMARAPMNTLAAFELARRQGADGIELDIHLSRDNQLVIIHDDTIDATTDGRGTVGEFTLAQLKRLDAGKWFANEFAKQRIPTLDEVFDAVGNDLFINVEIKAARDLVELVARRLADCVRRHKMRERVIVSCFDPVVLRRAKEMMPMILAGFLYHPAMPAAHYQPPKERWHEARHPWHEMVDQDYMNWARAQGYFVNVWTVNEPNRAIELRDLGVNAIITDDPARMIDALRSC